MAIELPPSLFCCLVRTDSRRLTPSDATISPRRPKDASRRGHYYCCTAGECRDGDGSPKRARCRRHGPPLTVMRSSTRMPPCGRSAALTGCRNGRTMGVPGPHGAVMTGLTHPQKETLNLARAFGRVMVEDLARRFEVSAQTIRKDLNDLCDHRSLTRIHGGAIIASGVENLAYEARRFVAAEEKKAIGAAAAALIPNGCSLFINIGTTTEEVASALTSHEDLLVITNNLNVAMLLYRHPRIEVIVAGGTVRRADGAVIGSTATSLIGQFKVDYAIIGASAIDEDGALLDFDYREVEAGKPIIANARSVMLVADSTKLRRSAPVRIADISQIQTFVTDVALPERLANICQTRGLGVIEAMPKSPAEIDEPGVDTPSTVARLR